MNSATDPNKTRWRLLARRPMTRGHPHANYYYDTAAILACFLCWIP
jgi:hypothetical protein